MPFSELVAIYYKNHEKTKDILWAKRIYFNVKLGGVFTVSTAQSVRINTHQLTSHDTALLHVIGQLQQ